MRHREVTTPRTTSRIIASFIYQLNNDTVNYSNRTRVHDDTTISSPVSIQTQSLALRALHNFTQQTQAPANRNARSKQWQLATMIGCLPTQALAFLAVCTTDVRVDKHSKRYYPYCIARGSRRLTVATMLLGDSFSLTGYSFHRVSDSVSIHEEGLLEFHTRHRLHVQFYDA